jgi:hypothetical protein
MSPSPRAILALVKNRVDTALIQTTVAIAAATAPGSPPARFTCS